MKILICGDSYMALDPVRLHLNHIHWSNHLGANISVENRACPGASNTMMLMQVKDAAKKNRYDGIVLGFTFCNRLEFSRSITTSHQLQLSDKQVQLDSLYRGLIFWPAELARNVAICEHAVMLARSSAPTVFVLNGLSAVWLSEINQNKLDFGLVDLIKDSMPLQLTGHDEWPNPDSGKDYGSFHVRDPAVHRAFADQVRQYLHL